MPVTKHINNVNVVSAKRVFKSSCSSYKKVDRELVNIFTCWNLFERDSECQIIILNSFCKNNIF